MSSDTNEDIKNILNLIAGGISVIACLWVFHFYSKTITPRPVSLKLILWLSTNDFIFSIANIISVFDVNTPGLCTFEALIRIFSVIASLYWSAIIPLFSYMRFKPNFQPDKFYIHSVLLGFIIPLIYTVSPLFTEIYTYGVLKFGCYAKPISPASTDETLVFMFLYDGIPTLTSLIATVVLYVLIAKQIKEIACESAVAQGIRTRRLFWYPAVIMIAYVTSFIDNLFQLYITSASESYTFTTVHILLTHTVGLTNALVYGLQRKKHYEMYEKPRPRAQVEQRMVPLVATAAYNNSANVTGLSFEDDIIPQTHKRSSYENELIQASMVGSG